MDLPTLVQHAWLLLHSPGAHVHVQPNATCSGCVGTWSNAAAVPASLSASRPRISCLLEPVPICPRGVVIRGHMAVVWHVAALFHGPAFPHSRQSLRYTKSSGCIPRHALFIDILRLHRDI